MIIPRHYEDLQVLHENTMASRAYYIPASRRMDTLVERREDSDRMQLLNGQWQFAYYASIYDLEERFFESDRDLASWDRLPVPGVWQTAGYDSHQYTNIRFPFPFDPPCVPQDNPCGAYVREFDYRKETAAPRACLNFEGVDSCFYVWLNGIYVGYSQVSHCTSEFDVTAMIREGKNRLAVLVLKWCDGSYLEDQDKFRMSGIFRDVYLLKRPDQGVWDYFVRTALEEDRARVSVEFRYFREPVATTVVLYDREDRRVAQGQCGPGGSLVLDIPSPVLWNPEAPYLYTLVITTPGEVIVDHVGLRNIHIENGRVCLNGKPVLFQGVNRHDSDPVTGPAVTLEQMVRDLTLMRQHNIHAIRASHYPNVPVFLQLCDRYGFLVVDEADLECHGPAEIWHKDNCDAVKFDQWNMPIADNPQWEASIVDRVRLMVERDKNRPCIVIWSMGNESAYGCNFEKALAWTKAYDPSRLTHYESSRYRKSGKAYDFSCLDLYSRMYPSLEEIREYLDRGPGKPMILCEYCHAMGNGPGDLEDYFRMFQAEDRLCGGFVWEWCDHAVARGKTGEGKVIYGYGGDHGEILHDGNFCMDGLVYPDRRPHTGLLEYKNVYRPVRAVSFDQETGMLTVRNQMNFTNLADQVEIRYEVSCDGFCQESGTVEGIQAGPGECGSTRLKIGVPKQGRAYLKLTYYKKQGEALVPAGHVLGYEEIRLETGDNRNRTALEILETRVKPEAAAAGVRPGRRETAAAAGSEPEFWETDRTVTVAGENFSYVYDKRTGLFSRMRFGGREYLDRPMELNIWRAPTDNDQYVKLEWKRAWYDRAWARAYDTRVTRDGDSGSVQIRTRLSLAAPSVQPVLRGEAVWVVDRAGGIQAGFRMQRDTEFPELPRFGLRLFLDRRLDQVTYYGLGPYENYRDKHQASCHGRYSTCLEDLHEDYIRPQENGSRGDCDYVILRDQGFGLAAASPQPFSFSASVYTQEELEKKNHNYELEPSGSTVLCLDYAQDGIGSNSCGPRLLKKYRFDQETFAFTIKLAPFVSRSDIPGGDRNGFGTA